MGGVGSLLRAVPPVASLRGLAVVALAIVVAYPSLAFARDPLKFIAVLSEAVSRLGVVGAYPSLAFARDPLKFIAVLSEAVSRLGVVGAHPSLAFARDPLRLIAVLSEAVSRLGVDDTREIRRTTLCKGVSPDVASRPSAPDLDLEESFGGI